MTKFIAKNRRAPKPALSLILVFAFFALLFGCSDGNNGKQAAQALASGEVHEFTFNAHTTGYIGVGGDIDGIKNPVLEVNEGDEVRITLVNKEPMAHDIAMEGHQVASEMVMSLEEEVTLTFIATFDDTYYCTVPGHRQAGMVGQLKVNPRDSGSQGQLVAQNTAPPQGAAPLKKAQKVDVDNIAASVSDIPGPINRNHEEHVKYTLRTTEVVAEIEDGTTFTYWTFEDTVPGPFLRVREGDLVTVTLVNPPESTMAHSIDLHAVTGPGGGAAYTQVPPGEERSITFRATHAGLFVYHCATPHIPTHLARGMYGMILVEPKEGLSEVDREFYVMQGDYYTTHRPGTAGHQEQDDDAMFNELPTYVLLNGRVGGVSGDNALKAEVGETIRIFYGVGGPAKISSFHIIGELFDRVYLEGGLLNDPMLNIQTTLVPAGGATMVELQVDMPGSYLLVDHSLTRLDKGLVGILEVTGPENPDILRGHEVQ